MVFTSINIDNVQEMSTNIDTSNVIILENVNCDVINMTNIVQENIIKGTITQKAKSSVKTVINESIETHIVKQLNSNQDTTNLLSDLLGEAYKNNQLLGYPSLYDLFID